jgi:flagellar hook assembly protein FlgD
MGQASGDAQSVYVYPTPWRPHGPNAGNGPGQTGTEQGGLTFANLPSQCTIRVYTISGNLVRELQHSDVSGPVAQEKWDGLTTHGEHAASGVYLWRVESSADSKTGKLMLIR